MDKQATKVHRALEGNVAEVQAIGQRTGVFALFSALILLAFLGVGIAVIIVWVVRIGRVDGQGKHRQAKQSE